jgi:hypothetical protein
MAFSAAFPVTQANKLFMAEHHFSTNDSPSDILHRQIEAPSSQEAAAKIALELMQGIATYTATVPSDADPSEAQGHKDCSEARETRENCDVVVVNASSVRYVRIRALETI